MKWPLQREDHNRQDKAKKADYRETFSESLGPGGSQDFQIRLEDVVRGTVQKKVMAQWRIEIAAFVERKLRSGSFEFSGYRFRFGMSAQKFALTNNIPPNKALPMYRKISRDAENRLRMTKSSALRAQFELSEKDSGPKLQITFKNFLQPTEPIHWDQYKRFRLNAVNLPSAV